MLFCSTKSCGNIVVQHLDDVVLSIAFVACKDSHVFERISMQTWQNSMSNMHKELVVETQTYRAVR